MSSPVDRRIKLLILALLTAILSLTAAIVSLAMQGRENNAVLPDSDTSNGAVSLYVQNGLWGIRTNSGRQITEPMWSNLRVMNDTILIAREGKGTERLYGLIDNKGETLVPFVYSEFSRQEDCGLWIAALKEPETDQTVYHLYNSDGTLCSLTAWDACTYENAVLTLTAGENTCTATYSEYGLVYASWYSEHTVGLRRLTMELNDGQLARLQTAETIKALGDSAAAFLSYLLVTPDTPPDASLIGSEDPSSLLVGSRYTGYRLQSAHVSRLAPIETNGLPAYRIQMQVRYMPLDNSSSDAAITTAMILTVSQNANGTFVYTSFSDIQAESTDTARAQNHMPVASALTKTPYPSHKKGFVIMKKVAVIMGSDSDFPVVKSAVTELKQFGVAVEAHVMSAHRTPAAAAEFAANAADNGFGVIICAAGMAAHLAGVIAGHTTLPVIGIPMKSAALEGMDALLATVMMPPGVPVATVGINGATNAALLAVQILAVSDAELAEKLKARKQAMIDGVMKKDAALQEQLAAL